MPGPKSYLEENPDRAAVIEHEVEIEATGWGLDRDRLRAVFVQLDQLLPPEFRTERPPGWAGEFSMARDVLGPEAALDLFEVEHPVHLYTMSRLEDTFRDPCTPLYSLADLANLLTVYADYQLSERENLLRTGHPQTLLLTSPWVYLNFARAYFIRRPVGFRQGGRILSWLGHIAFLCFPKGVVALEQMGSEPWQYVWGRRLSDGPHPRGDRVHYAWPPPDWQVLPYERAPLIRGLRCADGERLKSLRSPFLDARQEVFRELSRALTNEKSDGLWEACCRVLSRVLLWSDVDFLLRMDRHYRCRDVLGRGAGKSHYYVAPGGLSDVIELIGHVEEEIKIGQFARTKAALAEYEPVSTLVGEGSNIPVETYWGLVKEGKRGVFDSAAALYLSLWEKAEDSWKEFRKRVNAALETEFSDEVTVRVQVKRAHVHEFKPALQAQANVLKAYTDATGKVPGLEAVEKALALWFGRPEPERASASALLAAGGNVFRRGGDFWEVVYRGRVSRIKDARGMPFIALLLANPTREFPVLLLLAQIERQAPSGKMAECLGMTRQELDAMGMHLSSGDWSDSGPDAQAKEAYEARVEGLRADLAEAEVSGDASRLAELHAEAQALSKELQRDRGPYRRKQLPNPTRRAADTVSKAIRRSLEAIRRHDQALWRHLNAKIDRGAVLSYRAEPDTSWITE